MDQKVRTDRQCGREGTDTLCKGFSDTSEKSRSQETQTCRLDTQPNTYKHIQRMKHCTTILEQIVEHLNREKPIRIFLFGEGCIENSALIQLI